MAKFRQLRFIVNFYGDHVVLNLFIFSTFYRMFVGFSFSGTDGGSTLLDPLSSESTEIIRPKP